jgi:hypothetical protein
MKLLITQLCIYTYHVLLPVSEIENVEESRTDVVHYGQILT